MTKHLPIFAAFTLGCLCTVRGPFLHLAHEGNAPLVSIAAAAVGQTGGQLAFIRDGNIWLGTIEGTNVRQVTRDGSSDGIQYLNVCWVDASHLAFLKGEPSWGGRIGISDLAGNANILSQYEQVVAIGFDRQRNRIAMIRTVDLPAKDDEELQALWFAWIRPDGSKVSALRIVDEWWIADGYRHYVNVAPDGSQIAFGLQGTDVSGSGMLFDFRARDFVAPPGLPADPRSDAWDRWYMLEAVCWAGGHVWAGFGKAPIPDRMVVSSAFGLYDCTSSAPTRVWSGSVVGLVPAGDRILMLVGKRSLFINESPAQELWVFDPNTEDASRIMTNVLRADWFGASPSVN